MSVAIGENALVFREMLLTVEPDPWRFKVAPRLGACVSNHLLEDHLLDIEGDVRISGKSFRPGNERLSTQLTLDCYLPVTTAKDHADAD